MDNNYDDDEHRDQTCTSTGYQEMNINVPVSIKPFASASRTKTKCCGSPNIKPINSSITGFRNGSCKFIMDQNIVVEVPIEFGARASTYDTYVSNITASGELIDCDSISENNGE